MNDGRFAPPQARLAEPAGEPPFAAPPGVLLRIRLALLGILIYAVFGIVNVMQAIYVRHADATFAVGLVEPAWQVALAYGVHRQSRLCAAALLTLSLLPTVVIYAYTGNLLATPLWFVLLAGCGLGVVATIEAHRARRRATAKR